MVVAAVMMRLAGHWGGAIAQRDVRGKGPNRSALIDSLLT
jgi:hypothetical protein